MYEPRELTLFKVERMTEALTRRRGRRRSRGGRGRTRPALPAERSRLHERPEGENPETRQRGGQGGHDRQEIQAQGQQESADRGGEDPDEGGDIDVTDAANEDERANTRTQG